MQGLCFPDENPMIKYSICIWNKFNEIVCVLNNKYLYNEYNFSPKFSHQHHDVTYIAVIVNFRFQMSKKMISVISNGPFEMAINENSLTSSLSYTIWVHFKIHNLPFFGKIKIWNCVVPIPSGTCSRSSESKSFIIISRNIFWRRITWPSIHYQNSVFKVKWFASDYSKIYDWLNLIRLSFGQCFSESGLMRQNKVL